MNHAARIHHLLVLRKLRFTQFTTVYKYKTHFYLSQTKQYKFIFSYNKS